VLGWVGPGPAHDLIALVDLTLVNSIHPCVIQTDMGAQTFIGRARNIGTNDVDAARQRALSAHPIGRLGVPDDIAKGVVFRASDGAGFMTGAGLMVSTAQ
jgi:3(or 17)beta-hydroxysteroid dehydrogenase